MQDVAFGDFTLTEREALFEDTSNSIEVKYVAVLLISLISLFIVLLVCLARWDR